MSDEDPDDWMGQQQGTGSYLRQWLDKCKVSCGEEETVAVEADESEIESFVVLPASDTTVLLYTSYLRHQRYYDDLKHINYSYIDYEFGSLPGHPGQETSSDLLPSITATSTSRRLLMEQDKSLGKGGWCWDAAFVLAEYLIHVAEWPPQRMTPVLELGSGTGLCGMMVAKALSHLHVHLTDLPQVMPLLQRNARRNFYPQYVERMDESSSEHNDGVLEEYCHEIVSRNGPMSGGSSSMHSVEAFYSYWRESSSCISVYPLEWQCTCHQQSTTNEHRFDVVIAADVVASLYDPHALVDTIYDCTHADSVVYLTFKERLSSVHRQFESELSTCFAEIAILPNRPGNQSAASVAVPAWSRNRNPNIQLLIARQRRSERLVTAAPST
jgi:predicted nicotinamide N-methyase